MDRGLCAYMSAIQIWFFELFRKYKGNFETLPWVKTQKIHKQLIIIKTYVVRKVVIASFCSQL